MQRTATILGTCFLGSASLAGALGIFPIGPVTHVAAAEPPNPAVATVDGIPIDANAVRLAMVRRGADFLPRFSKLEEKEAVVEELVRIQVLAQKARQMGYLDDPEIQRGLNRLLAEKYWRDEVEATRLPSVTAEEVKAYYDANPAEFTPAKRVRGSVIVLRWASSTDASERAKIRAEAERIAAEAKGASQPAFARLVETHSQDPATRGAAGDTGFIVEGTTIYRFEPPVVDVLFEIDEIGGAVAVTGERGAYVVRLTERKGGILALFEQVEGKILKHLTAERKRKFRDERYAELRKHCDIAIDREMLRQIDPGDLAAGSRPPSFPVGEKVR